VILRASAEEHPDLFWGLRGGGGNFGVVTEFEFRLRPVGPLVLVARLWYSRSVAGELARFYRDVMIGAPDEIGGALRLVTAPSAEFVPREHRGRPACVLLVISFGDSDDGGETARALLEWGLGAQLDARFAPVVGRGRADKLHRARRGLGPRSGVLRRGEVRAAGGAEGRLRPRQRVRAQPEHPAERPKIRCAS
jgi:FAD/FMN-containing dehydrogenase